FSSRRRHTIFSRDWSTDVCSSDLTESNWVSFSAVISGIKEIRNVMAEAEALNKIEGRKTILFVDEIHRFNKAQQDAFLPYVESRSEERRVGKEWCSRVTLEY